MVSVILTDFIQAIIISIMVFAIVLLIFKDIGFTGLHTAISENIGEKGFNPLLGADYGFITILWIAMSAIVGFPSFAPNMQKLASSESSRTAKMMTFYGTLFTLGRQFMIILIGIGALAYLGSTVPEGIKSEEYSKVVGAIYLGKIVPPVMYGVILAGMLAAFISTVDTYILSSATVIVNDVVCPLSRKPVSERLHIWLLRIFVALIAIFLFLFGLFYSPEESIFQWILLTGAMMSGAGITLIGGLYWKKGSIIAANIVIIYCCIVPIADRILERMFEQWYKDNVNTNLVGLCTIVIGAALFCICSLVFPNRKNSLTEKGLS